MRFSMRDITGTYKRIVILATVVLLLLGLYGVFNFRWLPVMHQLQFNYLMLSFALFLVFLYYPMRKGGTKEGVPLYDLILGILAFALTFYLSLYSWSIELQQWQTTTPLRGVIAGFALWLLVIEATRRVTGWPFVGLLLLASVYPLFAGHMPGFLYGHQYSLAGAICLHAFSAYGLVGQLMGLFGRILVGYMAFGMFMQVTGAGKFFLDFSLALAGHARGGPAKVAVISSAMFGSVSGASLANITVTGSVTIPLMKRIGYAPHYAAGVEACSSIGGCVMPPIMGTTAFIMAQFLGVSYASIAIAAILPMVIFYTSLMIQVDGYAALHNMKGLPKAELPNIWTVLKVGWVYPVIFVFLVYLMFAMLMVPHAPYLALAVMLPLSMIRKETRLTLETVSNALVATGKVLAMLGALLASIGVIVCTLIYTGLVISVGSELIQVVGGNAPLLVACALLTCIILGMGMVNMPAYVLGAIVLAPAMVKLGYPILAVHFFIMHAVNLCGLTPPVCLTSYVGAGIADSPPMKTALTGMRIGIILFFLPVFMLFRPELLLLGTPISIVIAVLEATIGAAAIVSAFEGYLPKVGRLSMLSRLLLGSGGFLLLFRGPIFAVIGGGLIVGAVCFKFVGNIMLRRKE